MRCSPAAGTHWPSSQSSYPEGEAVRALVVSRPGVLGVDEVPDPAPGVGEVVVEVGACGICGTDLHIADGEFPPTPYPIVPGHEFAGQVVELGADARWAPGPRGRHEGGRGPLPLLRVLRGMPLRAGEPLRELERHR